MYNHFFVLYSGVTAEQLAWHVIFRNEFIFRRLGNNNSTGYQYSIVPLSLSAYE